MANSLLNKVPNLVEQEDESEWDEEEEEEFETDILRCLFCDTDFDSSNDLFEHCRSEHRFDFRSLGKTLGLDFYGSFKLINFVRSRVAENTCWCCGFTLQTRQDLHNHLHDTLCASDDSRPWEDDSYLVPFMQDDSLLYNFSEDCDDDEDTTSAEKMKDLIKFEDIHIDSDKELHSQLHDISISCKNEIKDDVVDVKDSGSNKALMDGSLRRSFAKVTANAIRSIDKSYFGSYSSFGIHREMISDKVRTEAYRDAILNNPSLLQGAAVLDVGCGTGILSYLFCGSRKRWLGLYLFAAQAGASSVIAVDGSDKMAAVATQIAKENGLLYSESSQTTGVIRVINGMVEELENSNLIQPNSIDVLVSEWMGYCLLYESMLSSVLFARDRWLRPGGAVLPDSATMYAAGFGRGGTSMPFWENVYGYNMSCIGNELMEEAARLPIVDVLDGRHIMTDTAVLQSFDLATMKPEEMDFTSTFELTPKLNKSAQTSADPLCKTTLCYGVVLWFDTGFTKRFCKETPIVLSTSPYTPPTHWSQTLLTFKEPIVMDSANPDCVTSAKVGSDANPAVKIVLRISIARAPEHRCIDISLEVTGIGFDGQKQSWPVQIFSLS